MRRRDFIKVISASAAAWPLAARAQQSERMWRVGVLQNLVEDDPLAQARNTAFVSELQELGWTVGRNVHGDDRLPAVINMHMLDADKLLPAVT
jgi:putative ABC transport system substrate-binding protein